MIKTNLIKRAAAGSYRAVKWLVPGLTGKLRKIFDEVASLPRRQQEKVMEFVEAFVNQQKISHQTEKYSNPSC